MGTVKVRDDIIHSAKIIIYKTEDHERLYLIVQEPEGIWGFVGGAEDVKDKDLQKTATREIQEEIGLTPLSYDLKSSNVTYEFVHTDPQSPRYKKKGILHAYTAEYNAKEPINLNPELIKYEWQPRAEVIKKLTDSYPYLIEVFQKVVDLFE